MKTGMNKSFVWILMVCLSLASCGHRQDDRYAVDLQETPERVCYPLSVNTTLYIKSLSVFTDETGREHLVFMSNNEPELYIYGLKSRSLEKTVRYHREGADGVGPKAGGFLMADWDEIYLPSLYMPEIARIDTAGHKLKELQFVSSEEGFPFIMTRSVTGFPMLRLGGKLYCMQLPNPRLGGKMTTDSPVGMKVDMESGEAEALPFCYPSSLCRESGAPALGIESRVSRCFNGKEFVYSFAFDEDLYVVSEDHRQVRRVPARSRYADKVSMPDKVPTDLTLATKMMCEFPFYGDVVYDGFREVYYRIAYPREDLELTESFVDLWQSGRSRFSVIVLDKDFRVIGEMMLPANRYRSDLYYVASDGFYISDSHYKSPAYDEDSLGFRRFVVDKIKR